MPSKKNPDKVIFAGGAKALSRRLELLKKNNEKFLCTQEGSVTIIDDGVTKKKYVAREITPEGTKIMQCCKEVKKDALLFLEKNLHLEAVIRHHKVHQTNPLYFQEFLKTNPTEIALVDVDHCYFRIAYLFNVISHKTYEKWKTQRDPRLTALGSFGRIKTADLMVGKKVMDTGKIKNDLVLVWKFILYKTFKAVSGVCHILGDKYFSYVTDGIYLPIQYAGIAQSAFASFDLPAKIILFSIEQIKPGAIILKNKETGDIKTVSFGSIKV